MHSIDHLARLAFALLRCLYPWRPSDSTAPTVCITYGEARPNPFPGRYSLHSSVLALGTLAPPIESHPSRPTAQPPAAYTRTPTLLLYWTGVPYGLRSQDSCDNTRATRPRGGLSQRRSLTRVTILLRPRACEHSGDTSASRAISILSERRAPAAAAVSVLCTYSEPRSRPQSPPPRHTERAEATSPAAAHTHLTL